MTPFPRLRRVAWLLGWTAFALISIPGQSTEPVASGVLSLDGPDWWIAPDPDNVGKEHHWWAGPAEGAQPTKIPWIIQDAFPHYHGVAWYWHAFSAAPNGHPSGRTLLRFGAVDYAAEVWLNGRRVGEHEGGESPFELDVTAVVRAGQSNLLAVRVVNPTHQPIDGMVLNETPHRNKALPYRAGSAWNQGGIMDSVELVHTPAVRVKEVLVQPDWQSGRLGVAVTLESAQDQAVGGRLKLGVGPASGGMLLAREEHAIECAPGESLLNLELRLPQWRLWELNDPFLYRLSVRLEAESPRVEDEFLVRFGFRDFRFAQGHFRLNGRRIYLRCSHTGNCTPIGLELPHDPDFLRRDLIHAKAMGFNAIRFIAGVPKRYQLDLCDEIGLMVYEESYAGWCLADSPHMARRYDESVLGMIRRDQNHPSVVIWGMLNETSDGAVFRHAVELLPTVRQLDPSRLVLLNSGRFDHQTGNPLLGLELWRRPDGVDPNVSHNPLDRALSAPWGVWAPGMTVFHPGPNGEYSVYRWTAPAEGRCEVTARFAAVGPHPTTDVHLLHQGRSLYDGWINLQGGGKEARTRQSLFMKAGEHLDFVVGWGNQDYGADSTALQASIQTGDGVIHEAGKDFSRRQNPHGPWQYGFLPPGPRPDAAQFQPYSVGETVGDPETAVGSLSNPGSAVWENVLSDQHPYQRVPHTADIIRTLRTLGGGSNPVWLSEYGIGSAVDLWRVTRHYERLQATHAMDAQFYRDKLDRFLVDWERWNMAEALGRPEDFFAASLGRMAAQRLLGLNAIRSNPNVVGYSLTGTVDQGMSGEGLWTTFREFKPGTMDAVRDGWAPLRWCLFAEPVHGYRGQAIRLEAVLANEDQLAPGDYPVRVQVLGPRQQVVYTRDVSLTIEEGEQPWVRQVWNETLAVDGEAGEYRLVASFQKGAAAAGQPAVFHLADRTSLPSLALEVDLMGEDADLAAWLREHGVRLQSRREGDQGDAGVILLTSELGQDEAGRQQAWQSLHDRIRRGACVVALNPSVFAEGNDSTRWLPLQDRGALVRSGGWLYHKDEWAKPHPVFEGLPTGLLDYTYYRELIPDLVWRPGDLPFQTVAGANDASIDYASGLMLCIHRVGSGHLILNTLGLREHLGTHPAADRLVLNLLGHAAALSQEAH